jgi:hypothetical protein
MVFDSLLWVHLLLIAANVAGLIICIIRASNHSDDNPPRQNEYLFIRLGWPPLLWLVFSFICAGPICYAMFPPSMPAREEALDRDPTTGVAYPKVAPRRLKWSWNTFGYEYYFTFTVSYTIGAWIAAEILGSP